MTRRQALALGAGAGIAATVGVPGDALAAATATVFAGAGPEYLRRSTYVDLVGERFSAGGHALRLVAVEDVLGARFDQDLRGHESAFMLTLEGPADALAPAIHELHHPLVGPFALYVSPVGEARGGSQAYEVTVDRTVRLKDVPEEPDRLTPDPAPPREEPKGEARQDEPPPSEPTERDREIVAERVDAARGIAERRRRRTRRARRKLRHTHARRIRFKRKQRTRVRTARRGWLKRHGR
ncbi:MAG TPA: hypothetical protein VHF89_17530 [Solirubrobacteraceae bacterium]|nr:hypothetical protein [Solirubrobacteraceae bacterium]